MSPATARLSVAVRHEARLQRRYGVWTAIGFVTLVWVALVWALPPPARAVALPWIMLGEASVTGLFMAAGLVLFERDERVLAPLAVSPLRLGERLAARVGLLTGASLAVAAVLTAATPSVPVRLPALLAGVGLAAVLVLLVALWAVTYFSSITDYVIGVQAWFLPLSLPALPALGIAPSPAWWLVPTHPQMRLIFGAYEGIGAAEATAAVVVSLAWVAAALPLVRRGHDRMIRRAA